MSNLSAVEVAVLVLLAMIFLGSSKPRPVPVRTRNGRGQSDEDRPAMRSWSRAEWMLLAAVVAAGAVNIAVRLAK